MARRGRSRKAGRRTPNGRMSRAGNRPEPDNWYLYIQRLAPLDPVISQKLLCIVSRRRPSENGAADPVLGPVCREDEWSREEQDQVASIIARAKNPNLAYPIGIAFELGLFGFSDARGWHDGRELMQAADIYAGLHRHVWGRLTEDIEQALTDNYGANAFDLLLEVGRVNEPAPPASFFRELVAGTPAPLTVDDPEEYQRRRLRLADRYGAARAVLQRDLPALLVVETVVVEGRTLGFLQAGRVLTERARQDRDALVAGLKALAEHFELFDERRRRRTGQVDRAADPAQLCDAG